jgi:hypothetical protein
MPCAWQTATRQVCEHIAVLPKDMMRLFEGEEARGTEAMQLAGLLRCAHACEKSWKVYRSSRLYDHALALRCDGYTSERADFILELEDLMRECGSHEEHLGYCCRIASAADVAARAPQKAEPRFGFDEAARILEGWARAESAAIHTYEVVLGCLTRAPSEEGTAPMLKTLWRHHAAFCNALAKIRLAQTKAKPSRELT